MKIIPKENVSKQKKNGMNEICEVAIRSNWRRFWNQSIAETLKRFLIDRDEWADT